MAREINFRNPSFSERIKRIAQYYFWSKCEYEILITSWIATNNFKDKISDDIISCFEHEYEKEGVHYMDIYVHAASVTKVDAYSAFN